MGAAAARSRRAALRMFDAVASRRMTVYLWRAVAARRLRRQLASRDRAAMAGAPSHPREAMVLVATAREKLVAVNLVLK